MFPILILVWAIIALVLSWSGMFYLMGTDPGSDKAFAAMMTGVIMAAVGLVAVAIYYVGGFAG